MKKKYRNSQLIILSFILSSLIIYSMYLLIIHNLNLSKKDSKNSLSPQDFDSDSKLLEKKFMYNWPGTGTFNDPIRIENYSINGNNNIFCLRFNFISVHVKISYCNLYGVALKHEFDIRSKFAGVIVIGSSNIEFYNCNITNNSYLGGVYLEKSSAKFINCNINNNNGKGLITSDKSSGTNLQIKNCTISGNKEEGVSFNSDNVFIDQCLISNNERGIDLEGNNNNVSNCLFINNSKSDINIYTAFCQTEIINNCFSKGAGIQISYFTYNEFSLQIENNTIDGKQIIYEKNLETYTVPNQTIGQLILQNVSNSDLVNLHFNDSVQGLILLDCTNINISKSNFTKSSDYSLVILCCNYIKIEKCNFWNISGSGILYKESNNTQFIGNKFSNIRGLGIDITRNLKNSNPNYIDLIKIENNEFKRTGIMIYPFCENLKITNCTVNGKLIKLLQNENNLYFNDTEEFGQIILENCGNINFLHSEFIECGIPVIIYNCKNVLVYNCIFKENFGDIFCVGRLGEINSIDFLKIINSSFRNFRLTSISLFRVNNGQLINCSFINTETSAYSALRSAHSSFNISGCFICNTGGAGIVLSTESFHCSILNNTIFDCTDYGLDVQIRTGCGIIKFNNFLRNGNGFSQARDDCHSGSADKLKHIFSYNYWSDGDHTDLNNDQIADFVYSIDGLYNNIDQFPLVNPVTSISLVVEESSSDINILNINIFAIILLLTIVVGLIIIRLKNS